MTRCQVQDLRCEYRSNPLGIAVEKPRLSWKIASDIRNVQQAAYQIQVSIEDDTFSALVWDTGKVNSGESIHVEYEGVTLQSRSRYYYRVKVWLMNGQSSEWSTKAWWETALMSHNAWGAEWMTTELPRTSSLREPSLYFRKKFMVNKAVRRARVYMTALGLYLLYCNGAKASDCLFAPGWTSYRSRLQYQTYDFTDQLHNGENVVGIILGDGWYKGDLVWRGERNKYGDQSAILFELHIEYEDGECEIISSDRTWRSTTGPILMSEFYHGELYDARLELKNWSKPNLRELAWSGSLVVAHPKDILIAQENQPVKVIEELKPMRLIRTPRGEAVLDMGQNMVGWIQFQLSGERGTQITLQHAEVLDKEGNFYIGNLRSAKQLITYIHAGGEAVYEPHFTFQGFRYVKVEGWPGELNIENFTGKVLHTDMEKTGFFECSHTMLNQLQRNIEWGMKGNFLDVPTDCPQRDERLGWTGDAQVFIRTSTFLMQVAPFFSKWLHDLKADQRPDGGVPFVIPHVLREEDHSSSAWGDAATICPWTLYECYGDKRILAEQYDSMKAWVNYIRKQGNNEFLWNTGRQLGDWLALDAPENSYMGSTPHDYIATIFYAYSTKLTALAAEVLGHEEEIENFNQLYENIVQQFRQEFVTPTGRLIAHTQTTYVLALKFDMLEEKDRPRAVESLVSLIKAHDLHLTTGFVGTPYLCQVLSRFGHTDIAYQLVLQESYPSWLYSVKQGATTIWEHWDSTKEDGSFWSDDMNSYNHYAYGSIGEWLYRVAGGIDTDADHPGYKHFYIRPKLGAGLDWVKASYQSAYGWIKAEWDKRGGLISIVVQVPPNSTATVVLPGASTDRTTESGVQLSEAEGIIHYTQVTNQVELELGSGHYRFEYPNQKVY